MERETGIEPATNSLEGCDSTTELLPRTRDALRPLKARPPEPHSQGRTTRLLLKTGGEGRTRTFEATRATDLQSAAFDRFATSPIVVMNVVSTRYPAEKPTDGAGGGI